MAARNTYLGLVQAFSACGERRKKNAPVMQGLTSCHSSDQLIVDANDPKKRTRREEII